MMARKHGIQAPRTPKGERSKVTIANQEKQIRLLIDRCETLNNELISAKDTIGGLEDDKSALQDEIISVKLTFEGMQDAYRRMEGFRDCAREVIQMFIGKDK